MTKPLHVQYDTINEAFAFVTFEGDIEYAKAFLKLFQKKYDIIEENLGKFT